MENVEKISGRGGARIGAGRKPGKPNNPLTKKVTKRMVSIRLSEDVIEWLSEQDISQGVLIEKGLRLLIEAKSIMSKTKGN